MILRNTRHLLGTLTELLGNFEYSDLAIQKKRKQYIRYFVSVRISMTASMMTMLEREWTSSAITHIGTCLSPKSLTKFSGIGK